MIDSLDRLSELLVGTEFEFSRKIELEIPESETLAFAIEVRPETGLSKLDVWKFFRALLDQTQRWPVIAGYGFRASEDWEKSVFQEDFFCRQEYKDYGDNREDRDFAPGEIVERANLLNLNHALKQRSEEDTSNSLNEKIIEYELWYTQDRFGIAPTKELIPSSFAAYPQNPDLGLEKWLLDWELKNLPSNIKLVAPDLRYLNLDEIEQPIKGNAVETLLLLPTPNSWETLAYLHYFGAGASSGCELMIALLKSWHERFDSELFACMGCELFFNVGQKPSTIEDAFQLAVEQSPYTDFLSLGGVSLRDHARSLLHIDHWWTFSKP
jgi:Domain of unknown function (DUF4253)